jgi:ABC-type bacteriocin/lantibiotic exporter with double-glycine peptidase domain
VRTSSEANGRLVETMRAVNRLRISGAESRALRRWSQLQAQYVSADISLRRVTLVQGLVLGLWPLVTVIVMVAVTAGSGATYAEFITAQTAAAIATASVTAAILAINGLLSGRATLRELDDVLEAQPEGRGSGAAAGRLNGGLTLQDLVFRYSPQGPAVLDGVSLTITPGEHVAIVGGSGCGKTTLMRVLLGLEVPESGTIMVDGRDLASLDQPSVRRQVGCVLQSSSLLPGTIVQNVDMGRGLSRDQIWQALDAAAVGDDVRAMGLGLDTPVVDGGGTVSGGQRQRILIARALAGDPRMLVLDEATSALDNVTQGIVVETLDRLRLTRIVVAHRLSTIRHADRIVVLDAGRIVEEGDYEQLMALDGQFAELARRQLA